jgi:predicted N-acetyltransferase YhbS
MLDNSNLIISAWDGNKLVGIARALTDFNYCCYLSDLAVDRDYQNLGIGKKLVARLKSELSDQVAILLLAAQTATEYYPKLGFEKANNAWIILRSN